MSKRCFGYAPSLNEFVEIRYNAVITAIDPVLEKVSLNQYVAPGWIDLQVNGFAGVDFNSPETTHEEIERSIRVIHSTGTTRFFPTVITGSPERMLASLKNLSQARNSLDFGAAMEGFHVEGPHISPEDGPRGAHPLGWVRKPDLDEYRRWQDVTEGGVRLVTLAPEWPNATSYIERVVEDGVAVSIGHTRASSEQIQNAVAAGATLCTHLGNAADSALPRRANYILDQMADDRLAASFIVDGYHLQAAFLRVALRAKGVSRSLLVTDAAMPAMALPGPYQLGEVDVELTSDQRVVLQGKDRLAGSALRMDHAISNVMRAADLSLTEAITMATRNPARLGRVGGRIRGLVNGDRADLVIFEFDKQLARLRVVETIMSGVSVWQSSN